MYEGVRVHLCVYVSVCFRDQTIKSISIARFWWDSNMTLSSSLTLFFLYFYSF